MIFTMILYLFLLAGSFLMILDYFTYFVLGIPLIPMVSIGFKVTGFVLAFLGVVLYHSRATKTYASKLIPLPNPSNTICLHIGKSNAKLLVGRKEEPNRIRAKGTNKQYMNIKDTGKSINVAGHDFTVTAQDVGSNLPLWVCDVVSKWKEKYGVRNEEEWLKLYNQIKNIKKYSDLEDIEFLKSILADDDKRRKIFDMSLEELREMRELLYDGREIGVKEYLDWADEATPYDNEAIIESTISQMRAQDQDLRNMQMMDMMKWIIPLVILLIFGAIAYQIFVG